MNIWYISKYARPTEYGYSTRHFYLSKEFLQMGHNPLVITSDSQPKGDFPDFENIYNYRELDEVETIFIKTKKFESSNSLNRILSWIDFELKLLFLDKKNLIKPEVIIISSLSLFTILTGLYFKKRYAVKLVFEVRDIWPKTIVDIGQFRSKNLFIKILSLIEKVGYKYTDILIGTLPNFEEHVNSVLNEPREVYCIPQGYDKDLMLSEEELPAGYKENYIPKDKFIIGYAGAIGESNALETFIECAKNLSNYKRIHFLLIGDGDKLEFFKEATKKLNNTTFAPKVNKEQVQSVIKYCDVMYDSVKDVELYKFGLSRNKWIDYMYAGKPIIVSYSGFKTMINESGCGSFVEAENISMLENEIIKYLKMEESELDRMGENGHKWLVDNRSYSKLANDFIQIIKNN